MYIASIVRGTTRPSRWTYIIWTLATGILALGYGQGTGGDESSWLFYVGFLQSFIILLLSLKYGKGKKRPGWYEYGVLSCIAVAVYFLYVDVYVTVLLITVVKFFAYGILWRDMVRQPRKESRIAWHTYTIAAFLNVVVALDTGAFFVAPAVAFCASLVTSVIIEAQHQSTSTS